MSRLSLMAVLTLVAVVVPQSIPAAAVTPSCPDSIVRVGFSDVSGLPIETVDAIDCIAHYGITRGATATTFEPHDEVSRWQMALFLARTTAGLGVDLPDGVGSAFGDVGDLDASTQRAITQIAQLGITTGIGPGRFSPHEVVPRWQMAVFLNRVMTVAGVALPEHVSQGFTDLGALPVETRVAIDRAAQLGIARGTGFGTYLPLAPVTRSQMALFLARVLEVGAATPWRLAVATSAASAPAAGAVIVTATVSKPNGDPFPGVLVDVFVTDVDPTTGPCRLDADAHVNGGDAGTSTDCRIDAADPRSGLDGKVTVGLAHGPVTETDTVVAWLGAIGETFDAGRTRVRATARVTWTAVAQTLRLPVPMGSTFGGQASVSAVVEGGGAGVAGQPVVFSVTRGLEPLLTRTIVSSAGGVATLEYSGPADPTAGDDPPVIDVIVAWWDRNGNGVDDGAGEPDAVTSITWDEANG